MSHIWRFEPDEVRASDYSPYRPVKKVRLRSWIAPEHLKDAGTMKKDFPRDDRGLPIEGRQKELVVDKRPRIMIKENKKVILTFL